jgi:hypothetical protein
VLGDEAAHKLKHRIQRRISGSGPRETKTLEAFDWPVQPSLDKALVLELARLDLVRRHDDLVVTGNSGTGKSHIVQAVALRACRTQAARALRPLRRPAARPVRRVGGASVCAGPTIAYEPRRARSRAPSRRMSSANPRPRAHLGAAAASATRPATTSPRAR